MSNDEPRRRRMLQTRTIRTELLFSPRLVDRAVRSGELDIARRDCPRCHRWFWLDQVLELIENWREERRRLR